MSHTRIVTTAVSFLILAGSSLAQSAQSPSNQVAKGPTPRASASNSTPTTKSAPTSLVDLNTASKQTLMTLPGITETSAQKIIENRPYKAKADLTQKKVISPDAYAKIEARINVKTTTRVSSGNVEKKAASSKGQSEVQKKE
jgi:DNA uptake protein ComE-like DNA-binding protein